MANGYYTHGTYPASNSSGSSSGMRAELNSIMAGLDLLPDPLGPGQKGFEGGSWDNPVITNGSIDGAAIGQVAPDSAAFTSMQAVSGLVGIPTAQKASIGTAAIGGATPVAAFLAEYVNSAYFLGTSGAFDMSLVTNGTVKAVLNSAGRFLLGGVTDDTASQLQVQGASRFVGNVLFSGSVTIGGQLSSATGGLELGSTTTAGTSYLDLHSSGTAADYDARLQVTGGSATLGQGTMSLFAAAIQLNVRPTFGGQVPWDHGNLPSPFSTTGGDITGNTSLYSPSQYSTSLILAAGANASNATRYAPYLRANNAGAGALEFINGAQTQVNLSLAESGYASFRNGANFALRPTWQGAVPYDTGNFNPAAYLNLTGGGNVNGNLNVYQGDINATRVQIGPGYLKMYLNQANGGPYIDFASIASQDTLFRQYLNVSNGVFYLAFENGLGGAYAAISNAGDVFVSKYGRYLGDWVNAKVDVRSGIQGQGYVLTASNAVTIGWNGKYNLYTDNAYQGDITLEQNFNNLHNAVSGVAGGVGTWWITRENAAGLPGGSWQQRGSADEGDGHFAQLYVRVG